MMEGWKEYELNKIVERFIDYRGKTPSKKNFGIPLVTAKIVKNGRIEEPNEFISPEDYNAWMTRGLPKKNDIVLTTEAPLGELAIITDEKIALAQRIITLRVNENFTHYRFLKYLFESDYGQHLLLSRATGTTVLGIKSSALKKIRLNLPPLPTQRKIAKILSAYDDLIENNLKRIKLLEEMAQITYEEWFVRMKFPGHETAVFDEETGLPEGWENKKLKTFLSIKHGYAYKGEFFTEMETNRILLTPGNFKIGGGIQLKKIKYYSDVAECPKDYILKRNDLLLTMTDLSKMGDTLGYPLLIPSSNKLFLHNQRLGKVQLIKGDFFPKYFLYFLFKEDGYRAFVVGSSSGATVKHTSPNKILSFKAKFPDLSSDIVKEFERKIKPTFESIDKLQQQNQLLKEARDILLPRLMTGMISV